MVLTESPNDFTTSSEHSSDNICGQHAHNGDVVTRIDISLGLSDLPHAESVIFFNLKKSVLESFQTRELLGMVIQSLKMEIL